MTTDLEKILFIQSEMQKQDKSLVFAPAETIIDTLNQINGYSQALHELTMLTPVNKTSINTIYDEFIIYGPDELLHWNKKKDSKLTLLDPVEQTIFASSVAGSLYTIRNSSVCACSFEGMYRTPTPDWWQYDYNKGLADFWIMQFTKT